MANLFGIPEQHMENWGDALISKNPPWTTTPEYHQWASKDLTQQKSKELSQIPYVGNLAAGVFELAAPFLAGGASPIYDIPQAIWKYNQEPDKYSSVWNAIDREDVLSAAWNRFRGAGKPLYNRMQSGLASIKNKFSGSAQAATPGFGVNPFEDTKAAGQWYKQQKYKKMSQAKKQAALQQRIRQHEAAQAANVPGTPIVPTGGGGGGGGGYQPTTKAQNIARTASRVGPGGNIKAYGLASGGIVDLYRHGGF